MQKTLVLMRHGKAQTLAGNQQDFDRELSEAGKRSLVASLPSMLSPLGPKCKSALIVSSPAPRAAQSAELLKDALNNRHVKTGEVLYLDALWNQDAPAFIEAILSLKDDMVFAVGHNPFVEQFIFESSGATLPCATGALAALSFNFTLDSELDLTSDNPKARLIWFSQGPISQRWKTIVQLESELNDAAKTVKARLESFIQDPEDIETMHKLRVSIRTLRSLVAFVKPWQDPKQNSVVQSLLKGIVARTSRQRELDVFAEQAHQSTASSSELIDFCDLQASNERLNTLDVLQSKKIAKDLDLACKNLKSIRWKKSVKATGLDRIDIRQHFDEIASDLEFEVEHLNLADVELTHDVRKKAKRVRYVAENFKQILGDDAVDIAKGMTAHQDNLGAICDARVNIQLINEVLESDLPEPVAWDLALLRAQNETFLYSTLRTSHSDQFEDSENSPVVEEPLPMSMYDELESSES